MPKKTRSAKGEMVDFDLMKIKEQIANAAPPADVRAREDFVDRRLRRRLRRVTVPAPAPKLPSSEPVDVKPVVPSTTNVEGEMIEEVKEPVVKTAKKKTAKTKQKARKT